LAIYSIFQQKDFFPNAGMEIPVPLTQDNDPINILLLPFDPLPIEQRTGEEDIFWKMVSGEMQTSLKAHEEMKRRADAEKARLDAIEAQKALMMGGYNPVKKIEGGSEGEVVYESLVRPTKAVAKGEFPLMKLSTASVISPVIPRDDRLSSVDKPIPKVANVPPKPPPKEEPKPPVEISHTMDPLQKGLLANANFHIHRSRHDPTNLYWSMGDKIEQAN